MHAIPASNPTAVLSAETPRAVAVNASLFRSQRGAEPQGHGWWLFDFYTSGQCLERHWQYNGEYARALEAARAHAHRIGATGVELLP